MSWRWSDGRSGDGEGRRGKGPCFDSRKGRIEGRGGKEGRTRLNERKVEGGGAWGGDGGKRSDVMNGTDPRLSRTVYRKVSAHTQAKCFFVQYIYQGMFRFGFVVAWTSGRQFARKKHSGLLQRSALRQ